MALYLKGITGNEFSGRNPNCEYYKCKPQTREGRTLQIGIRAVYTWIHSVCSSFLHDAHDEYNV